MYERQSFAYLSIILTSFCPVSSRPQDAEQRPLPGTIGPSRSRAEQPTHPPIHPARGRMNNSTSLTNYTGADSFDRDITSCLETDSPSTEFYRFVTNGVLLNVIGLFGILGNVISMIILSRPQMRSSINYLLIGLARIDIALILTSILLFGLTGIYPYTGAMFTYFYYVYPHIVPVVYPLASMVQTASVYLTLTVSLERFVAVCHPLRARSLCTCGRAKLYVVGIIVFSIVYNLPKFFEATIQTEWYAEGNVTVYCARPTHLRLNEVYVNVYIHWCYLIFVYLLPFLSLAVLNACIYRQVSAFFTPAVLA